MTPPASPAIRARSIERAERREAPEGGSWLRSVGLWVLGALAAAVISAFLTGSKLDDQRMVLRERAIGILVTSGIERKEAEAFVDRHHRECLTKAYETRRSGKKTEVGYNPDRYFEELAKRMEREDRAAGLTDARPPAGPVPRR